MTLRAEGTAMIETLAFMVKAAPVVFLAGLAAFPVSGAEDVLIRTAAGLLAAGAIWKVAVRPGSRWCREQWDRTIGRFFEDHHDAVIGFRALQQDVRVIKGDIVSIKDGLAAVQSEQRGRS